MRGYGGKCHFQQYFSYIVAVSFTAQKVDRVHLEILTHNFSGEALIAQVVENPTTISTQP